MTQDSRRQTRDLIRQIHARHGHRGDAFLAPDEPEPFVGRGFHADLFPGHAERDSNALFHFGDVRV